MNPQSFLKMNPAQPFQVMYWRPKQISRRWLWAGMLASLAGLLAVEWWPQQVAAPSPELTAAAEKADEALRHIKDLRIAQGHRALPKLDPSGSHLIGPSMSMVTSKLGSLESKQTSINPNLAAVVVRWLEQAGVEPGDSIAIGASGSWPALNIAVYAAAETLQLKPTIVLSVASSQYGANSPDMMWIDMERQLRDAGIFPESFAAQSASLGGLFDRAAGMTEPTREMLELAATRNGVPVLDVSDIEDSVGQRMEIYQNASSDQPYAAYINVGGGSASIGGTAGNACFSAGVHRSTPSDQEVPDCVASRMLTQGVPIVNVVDAKQIAESYGLAIAPAQMPRVGQGSLFSHMTYRRPLAAALICMTWVWMSATVFPRWYLRTVLKLRRLVRRPNASTNALPKQVEWMV
ncbi:poly-gamma-glutamate system protein [Rosistilla oblonga]|uniref:poly-gamma-glutamate system protein n=1 Tax=Rosistilla oblonga TaxID=2527990 RepID=UPI003A97A14C